MAIPHVSKIVDKLPDPVRDDFWGHLGDLISSQEADTLVARWSTIEEVLVDGLEYTHKDLEGLGIDVARYSAAGKVSLVRVFL
jgi:hypothetical protein